MEEKNDTYTKTYSIDVERANYHHKCRKRKLKRVIIVLIIWIIVFAYFFTPLSKVNLKVKGNIYYSKSDLMKMAYINKDDYWWLLNTKNVKKSLESYNYIESIEISKSFFRVNLKINEIYPLAVKNNKYIMSSNEIIEKENYDLNYKVNNIISFDNIDDTEINSLINEYKEIKLEVRTHFDNIEIISVDIGNDETYKYVKIYGNDDKIGYFVIKTDFVYLNTKFNKNKYNKIVDEIAKNNVKYEKSNPALIAYHYIDEEEFKLVEYFEEE